MPSPRATEFLLDADLAFLNHGSFGACPRVVLDAQTKIRERLERDPVRFLALELPGLIDAARREAAAFVDADAENFVFIRNATTAVNTVLASFPLQAGDELLVTNHGYAACRNAAEYWAGRSDARVVEARLPWPATDAEGLVEAVLASAGPRTRLALLDHVTSPSALVLPIEQLVRQLQRRGVAVLVDGAHAPGMVPLSVRSVGADYYTGNFHKWCCAAKGSAFLVVAPERQATLRPLVVSHGATAKRAQRPRAWLEFDWVGSEDPSAYLTVPCALEFLGSALPGGASALREHNRTLAHEARQLLISSLAATPTGPLSMVGAMATLTLPDSVGVTPERLYHALLEQHRIQVPVFALPGQSRISLRVSAQLYNSIEDYQRLVTALETVTRPVRSSSR
jgi:isopenicillin-N epimerase